MQTQEYQTVISKIQTKATYRNLIAKFVDHFTVCFTWDPDSSSKD